MGRHKIDVKKISETQLRQVCFSKRRKGLFKKAADICAASRTYSVAIIVFSAAGNLFTFAHPSVEAISRRFSGNEALINQLSNYREPDNTHEVIGDNGDPYQDESNDSYDFSDAEFDYDDDKEEVMRYDNNREDSVTQEVGEKKEEMENTKETREMSEGDQFWWNKPIHDLRLEELLEFEKSIMKLRDKVHDRASFLLAEKPLSICSWHHKL